MALVSACALAACNPGAPAGDAGGAGGGAGNAFPNLFQTAYRAEGTMTNPEDGQPMPVVMIRDGRRMRLEMTSAQGQMAIINNPDSGETFMVTSSGGQTVAMRVATADYSNPAEEWQAEMSTATFVGPCSGAGQTGTEWTRTEGEDVSNVCVTGDGIVLRASENGQTTWETTGVQRGSQNAALFAAPAGVRIVDMTGAGP
jgi:hypothetical protein